MASRKVTVAFILWITALAIGVLSATVFAHGIIRDQRIGEPDLTLRFAEQSGWLTERFRLWGEGSYRLFVSSVNHDPAKVGDTLDAEFEIAVIKPDGSEFFHRRYPAGSIEHAVPDNYGDVLLETLELSGWPVRSWVLKARVVEPDPGFAGVRSEVKLWKTRYDPGMGGLITYAMMIPAGLFLGLALVFAALLWNQACHWPMYLTLPFPILFLALFVC